MGALGTILLFLGLAIAAVGGIWMLVVAFQESVLWGLGCLFLAPVTLVFIILHWATAWKPFVVQLTGLVVMVVGAVITGEFRPPATVE